MIELLSVAIGIGLGVSLLMSEVFGLLAGGLVVPGYLALHLSHPFAVALTLLAGVVTYITVQALSSVMIIYGRRRMILLILVGYLIGYAMGGFMQTSLPYGVEFAVIGFIIPGLIAIWIDRRGIIESLCSIIVVSVIVRLIMVILFGEEMKS